MPVVVVATGPADVPLDDRDIFVGVLTIKSMKRRLRLRTVWSIGVREELDDRAALGGHGRRGCAQDDQRGADQETLEHGIPLSKMVAAR